MTEVLNAAGDMKVEMCHPSFCPFHLDWNADRGGMCGLIKEEEKATLPFASHLKLPEKCPLREGPLVVRLKEGVK